MICPCEYCLIKPICRNKHYPTMHKDCNIIEKYLFIGYPQHTKHRKRVKIVEKTLKPLIWKLGQKTDYGFLIDLR